MTITLQAEHERLIAEALRSGAYQSSEEVIKQALELLCDRDAWLARSRAKIADGYAAAQRGELIDSDQVRAQMEQNKRRWLAGPRKA
jgi:antitoxin ParD1/3/4